MPHLNRDGFSTYYEEFGSGDPLVLVAGISADLRVWKSLVPELSQLFRVIIFDNRGVGRSSSPDTPYTIQGMADDLNALLLHLNIASTKLLGWSMGGLIAQAFCLRYPDKAKQLILMGSFPAADAQLSAAIHHWVTLRQSSIPYEHVAKHIAWLNYSPALASNEKLYPLFIDSIINNPDRQTVVGFSRQAQALTSYVLPEALNTLNVPTTVLVGEHDILAPAYLSESLARIIPNAVLHILPGAHAGFIEFPKPYLTILVEALSAQATITESSTAQATRT